MCGGALTLMTVFCPSVLTEAIWSVSPSTVSCATGAGLFSWTTDQYPRRISELLHKLSWHVLCSPGVFSILGQSPTERRAISKVPGKWPGYGAVPARCSSHRVHPCTLSTLRVWCRGLGRCYNLGHIIIVIFSVLGWPMFSSGECGPWIQVRWELVHPGDPDQVIVIFGALRRLELCSIKNPWIWRDPGGHWVLGLLGGCWTWRLRFLGARWTWFWRFLGRCWFSWLSEAWWAWFLRFCRLFWTWIPRRFRSCWSLGLVGVWETCVAWYFRSSSRVSLGAFKRCWTLAPGDLMSNWLWMLMDRRSHWTCTDIGNVDQVIVIFWTLSWLIRMDPGLWLWVPLRPLGTHGVCVPCRTLGTYRLKVSIGTTCTCRLHRAVGTYRYCVPIRSARIIRVGDGCWVGCSVRVLKGLVPVDCLPLTFWRGSSFLLFSETEKCLTYEGSSLQIPTCVCIHCFTVSIHKRNGSCLK